eukprot:2132370-Rhodomonas_salina.1
MFDSDLSSREGFRWKREKERMDVQDIGEGWERRAGLLGGAKIIGGDKGWGLVKVGLTGEVWEALCVRSRVVKERICSELFQYGWRRGKCRKNHEHVDMRAERKIIKLKAVGGERQG